MMRSDRLWTLVAKKKSGEASIEELEELKQLLAQNTSSGYTNEIIEKVWNTPLSTIPENKLSETHWQRIHSRTSGADKRIFKMFTLNRWMSAASILVVVTLAGIIAYNYFNGDDTAGHLANNGNMNQVTTRPGSKSKLELPDGTQVWLNGDSKLTYSNGNFGKDNREVMLTGEAFFDVVKNEAIPFIIHTGSVNITVKGTAFNVKAYPKENTIETSLVRGLVEITTQQDPDRKILLKPNEKIIIPVARQKNEGLVNAKPDSAESALYSITKLQTSSEEPPEIAWMNTQLVFDDEPFATIAPKMESWYNIRIYFITEELKNMRFSGVIEKETLKETLEAMQLSSHFNYQVKGKELWVGKK